MQRHDDRLVFITADCLKNTNTNTKSIGSTDTDVLISLLFHIGNCHWIDDNKVLHLIWGSGTSRKIIDLNQLGNDVGWDIINTLPAYHAFTGCDTTSDVGSKAAIFKLSSEDYSILKSFGAQILSPEIIKSVEEILVKVVRPNSAKSTFDDELRLVEYNTYRKTFNVTKCPCTSAAVKMHIRWACFQTSRWLNATFKKKFVSQLTGLRLDGNLILVAFSPSGLCQMSQRSRMICQSPEPCNCGNCTFDRYCVCRQFKLPCCAMCKCQLQGQCKKLKCSMFFKPVHAC